MKVFCLLSVFLFLILFICDLGVLCLGSYARWYVSHGILTEVKFQTSIRDYFSFFVSSLLWCLGLMEKYFVTRLCILHGTVAMISDMSLCMVCTLSVCNVILLLTPPCSRQVPGVFPCTQQRLFCVPVWKERHLLRRRSCAQASVRPATKSQAGECDQDLACNIHRTAWTGSDMAKPKLNMAAGSPWAAACCHQ